MFKKQTPQWENTVEPRNNEVLRTMKITLLYQVSHYIRVKKQRDIKSWDQQNYLVIRGFCYIRPLYNEVPLYSIRFPRVPSWACVPTGVTIHSATAVPEHVTHQMELVHVQVRLIGCRNMPSAYVELFTFSGSIKSHFGDGQLKTW